MKFGGGGWGVPVGWAFTHWVTRASRNVWVAWRRFLRLAVLPTTSDDKKLNVSSKRKLRTTTKQSDGNCAAVDIWTWGLCLTSPSQSVSCRRHQAATTKLLREARAFANRRGRRQKWILHYMLAWISFLLFSYSSVSSIFAGYLCAVRDWKRESSRRTSARGANICKDKQQKSTAARSLRTLLNYCSVSAF